MYEYNLCNFDLSEVVGMLGKDGTFLNVSSEILSLISQNTGLSNVSLMQLDLTGRKISVISEVGKGNFDELINQENIEEFGLCKDEFCAFSLKNATGAAKKTLEKLNMGVSFCEPVLINGMVAMYVFFFDENSDIDISEDSFLRKYIKDIATIIQSIAQSKVTNSSLVSSYEVLKDILGNIGSGIIVCSKNTGTILFENSVATSVGEVRETIKDSLEAVFRSTEMEETLKLPMEKYNADSGLWFEVKFSCIKWIDGSDVIVATASDITQKKKNQQKIEYQAHNDFLTGLYNRMKCEVDLRRIIRHTEKEGKKGAVLFIDLDDFKHINDGLGHQYGDILLQQIAAGLTGIPGLRGHVYRMGGDEFVVIIEPDLYPVIERVLNNIVSMFNKPWYLMETEYFCTMSMGVATFPDNSADVHEIIRKADVAMYQAKRAGKNCFEYYDHSKDDSSAKQLDIESNMRQAIATGIEEFVVFYQPVVDINTGMCSSCEALVRWDSKAMGFMGPGDFIPLAEYLGLITSIGDYVLETACKQCKFWNDNGYPDFRINVNLSVVQLMQKDVVDLVRRIISKTGVNPCNIVLEITETFAINDMKRVLSIIQGLKEIGIQIALDDFGTGYSSLNYIKQLPLDIIKVDKTFIDDVVEDDYAQAFIKLIVDLSKTIGTKIVVEGVEQKEQYELLKELGVDYIQGYYFGKPVPAKLFEKSNLERGAFL